MLNFKILNKMSKKKKSRKADMVLLAVVLVFGALLVWGMISLF